MGWRLEVPGSHALSGLQGILGGIMSFWNLFKPSGDTISKSVDSIGNLAKDMRTAITGDIPPEKRAELLDKAFDVMVTLSKTKSDIIVSEAQSESWITRTWRPLVMIDFAVLINLVFFGIIGPEIMQRLQNIPPQLWTLLSIGIGGYIGGRSGEKIVRMLNKRR